MSCSVTERVSENNVSAGGRSSLGCRLRGGSNNVKTTAAATAAAAAAGTKGGGGGGNTTGSTSSSNGGSSNNGAGGDGHGGATTTSAAPGQAAPTAATVPPLAKAKPCCLCWCCCCSCSCSAPSKINDENGPLNNSNNSNAFSYDDEPRISMEDVRSWGTSFDKLMRSSAGRKVFRDFLKCEYSEENILFWLACEELKTEMSADGIEEKARIIYEDYISILSPKEVSLDSRVREIVNRNMVEPTPNTFDEAQQQIYTLMHRDSYPRFVNSVMYKTLLAEHDTNVDGDADTGGGGDNNSSGGGNGATPTKNSRSDPVVASSVAIIETVKA